VLQAADELMTEAVKRTVRELKLEPQDTAAVKLAGKYAHIIDTHPDPAWALRWIGPLLFDVLSELGATPGARAKQEGRKTPDAASSTTQSRLAQLRASHR
jgi:hypothetical protein